MGGQQDSRLSGAPRQSDPLATRRARPFFHRSWRFLELPDGRDGRLPGPRVIARRRTGQFAA